MKDHYEEKIEINRVRKGCQITVSELLVKETGRIEKLRSKTVEFAYPLFNKEEKWKKIIMEIYEEFSLNDFFLNKSQMSALYEIEGAIRENLEGTNKKFPKKINY